jgi:heme exporter protein A
MTQEDPGHGQPPGHDEVGPTGPIFVPGSGINQPHTAPEDPGHALQLADEPQRPPLVRAFDLDFGSGERRLFAQLSFTVPAGAFGLVTGPAGSGKSTLLLAIAGRMRGLTGELRVDGLDALARTRRVRQITSLARAGGLVDVEQRHRVTDAISDRAGIEGLSRDRARRIFETCCAALDVEYGPKQLVADLDMLHQSLLAAILAVLRPTRLLLVDDLHLGLQAADQNVLAAALHRLAANGITVIASSLEPTTTADHVVRIPLPTPQDR